MDESFAASLRSLPWFERCGETAAFDVPFPSEPVYSWAAAMAACDSPAQEHASLEARNRLTSFLAARFPERDRRWNEITSEVKRGCITPLAEQVWKPFAQSHALGGSFLAAVEWQVLGALMEHEYRDCKGLPRFFSHLLEVYRDGHVPCGWVGQWPAGKLLFF